MNATGPEKIFLPHDGSPCPKGYVEPGGSGWGVRRYALRVDVYSNGLNERLARAGAGPGSPMYELEWKKAREAQ